jgi:hypothetical protein
MLRAVVVDPAIWERVLSARRDTDAQAFAAAVAELERRTGVPPDDHEIAEHLRWNNSPAALVALGQEARSLGLVRTMYEATSGERRYCAAE